MTRGRETEREGTTVGAETTAIGTEGIGVVTREGIEAEAGGTIGETATEEVEGEVVAGEVTTGDDFVHSPLSVSVLEKSVYVMRFRCTRLSASICWQTKSSNRM